MSVATPSANTITTVIDVQSIAPPQRHAQIFAAFDALAVGQAIELRNDHDPLPLPLQRQFNARNGGQFGWDYLERGPMQWRVRLSRITEPGASCCGSCGGGGH